MNNKVTSNLIWRLLERFGAQGVTFVVSIVLARILDPAVYGSIALTNFGFIDKKKYGIIAKLNDEGKDSGVVNTFIDDINIEIKDTKDYKTICNLLNKKPGKFLKEIFNDLEEKLINKRLENDKEKLGEYIVKTYGG